MNKKTIAVITNTDNLDEFRVLAHEAGYEIVDYIYVKRFIGRGLSDYKINEIKNQMNIFGLEHVIFDASLKPRYLYNIAMALGIEPKDRLEIILEIFEKHSPSKEADLQIKLASLQYELARAKERVRLRKFGEQTALTRGLGAYEVDLYYKEIQRRIQTIKRKLYDERKKRDVHRIYRRKKGYKTISIAGYYSSGKTTLFNRLTGLMEKIGEEPFTTLSTKFSLVRIGPWKCYLVDTIGFISDLPPFMVTAFYSTLEEIIFSDLVLLLIDISEPYEKIRRKFLTSWKTLHKLGYDGNILIVGNKIDEINNESFLKSVSSLFQEYSDYVIMISAKKCTNIDMLIKMMGMLLGKQTKVEVRIPYSAGWSETLAFLKSKLGDIDIKFEDEYMNVDGFIDDEILWSIKQFIKKKGGKLIVSKEDLGIKAHTQA